MSNDQIYARTTTFSNASHRLFFARPAGKLCFPVFVSFMMFAIIQSVPDWRPFESGINLSELLILAGTIGAVCGFLGAERRFAGTIALALSGIGAVAAVGILVLVWPSRLELPIEYAIFPLLVGSFPGVAFYWFVERMFERPANAIDVVHAQKGVQSAISTLQKRLSESGQHNEVDSETR